MNGCSQHHFIFKKKSNMHWVWGRIKSACVKVIDNGMSFTNSWHNINRLDIYQEHPNVIYLSLNHLKQTGSKPSRSACK